MALAWTTAPDPTSRPVLLIVEDHQDTRQMYAEFLETHFDIMQAVDGQDAVEAVGRRRPDVIITDLSLPRLDGFELVAFIRCDPALKPIPIICLSGYGGHAHETRAREAGCDRILQKPCMPDALGEAALELVRDARSRSEAR
jgi:CheY-like chemotaxis protein